jgi:hypothetical protein
MTDTLVLDIATTAGLATPAHLGLDDASVIGLNDASVVPGAARRIAETGKAFAPVAKVFSPLAKAYTPAAKAYEPMAEALPAVVTVPDSFDAEAWLDRSEAVAAWDDAPAVTVPFEPAAPVAPKTVSRDVWRRSALNERLEAMRAQMNAVNLRVAMLNAEPGANGAN